MLVLTKLARYNVKTVIHLSYDDKFHSIYNLSINDIDIGFRTDNNGRSWLYTGYATYCYENGLNCIIVYTKLDQKHRSQYFYERSLYILTYTRYIFKKFGYYMYSYRYNYENKSNILEIVKSDETTNRIIEIKFDYLNPLKSIDIKHTLYDIYKQKFRQLYKLRLKYKPSQIIEIVLLKDQKILKYQI